MISRNVTASWTGKGSIPVACTRKWLEVSINLFVGANRWNCVHDGGLQHRLSTVVQHLQ